MFQSNANAAAQAAMRLRFRFERRQSSEKRYKRMLKPATPVQCPRVLPRMGLHIFIQVSKILILLLTFTGNYV
jgi:hypothetical protein